MRELLPRIVLAAIVGGLIGIGATISYGWKLTFAAAGLLILIGLAGLTIRALRRGNRKSDQIVREEIDEPREHDEFGMEVRADLTTPAITYDLTIGVLVPGDQKATEDSQSILRRLTRDDLITVIALHGGSRWQALTPTGRLTLRGGAQLIWHPTATDTTGETR